MAKQKKQKQQKQKKDTRERIDNTLFGFYTNEQPCEDRMFASLMLTMPCFVLTFFFAAIAISGLGVTKEYLLGLFLALEICFIIFNILFKKKANVLNVIGYKFLSFYWGSGIYNIILLTAMYYKELGRIVAMLLNGIIWPLAVIAIIIGYICINWAIVKGIEDDRKERK